MWGLFAGRRSGPAVAEMFWPGADPIGRSLLISKGNTYRQVQIVGMVPDVIGPLIGAPATTEERRLIYVNQEIVRRSIDRELARIDPGGVLSIQSMTELFTSQFFPFTVIYAIAVTVGVLA
jgi:hypothetical protein